MKFERIFEYIVKLYNNVNADYLGLLAAGVAFYFLMASFPALAAAISLYGLFSDPNFISEQISIMYRFLPEETVRIFANQAEVLVSASGQALGVGFVVSTLIALYSATKGVGALIKGLNIAYNEQERRGVVSLALTGFILTAGLLVYLLIALTLIAGLPAFLNLIRVTEFTGTIYLWLRWPLLFVTALMGLEILYSFAPCHSRFKWRWASWGSFLATAIWLLASSFFSAFVTHFGKYNETYGSISAIVILLIWFWMSSMIILLGAEINSLFKNQKSKELDLKAGSESQVEEVQIH